MKTDLCFNGKFKRRTGTKKLLSTREMNEKDHESFCNEYRGIRTKSRSWKELHRKDKVNERKKEKEKAEEKRKAYKEKKEKVELFK